MRSPALLATLLFALLPTTAVHAGPQAGATTSVKQPRSSVAIVRPVGGDAELPAGGGPGRRGARAATRSRRGNFESNGIIPKSELIVS